MHDETSRRTVRSVQSVHRADGFEPSGVALDETRGWTGALDALLECEACGEKNPAHMRYCRDCGTQLMFSAAEGLGGHVMMRPAQESWARLVTVQNNGVDGKVYELASPQVDVGSRDGDIVFLDDPYVSARHARIVLESDRARIIDLGSVNGVYIRLREPTRLQDGDHILLGQQVVRFERPALRTRFGPAVSRGVKIFGTPEVSRSAWLIQVTTEGTDRDAYCLYREETVLGRESGDIVFTDDPFLSRRHASIGYDRDNDVFFLEDLGSSNGTGLKIRGEKDLISGHQVRIGRQLLRFEQNQDTPDTERYD